jgi:hypothetical protein
MFVVPLLAALFLLWQGSQVTRLLTWSRREVIVGKMALGVFFICAAVLLVVLGRR